MKAVISSELSKIYRMKFKPTKVPSCGELMQSPASWMKGKQVQTAWNEGPPCLLSEGDQEMKKLSLQYESVKYYGFPTS